MEQPSGSVGIHRLSVSSNISTTLLLDDDYISFLDDVKKRLKVAQLRVATMVNTHVIKFYWQLDSDILHMRVLGTFV